jgi:four helix bundle protein
MRICSAKDLDLYRKAHAVAMAVFQLSKSFPPEERYALTSQVRRSSRSVCLNLREAWAKRRYEAHFISKLTDCDGGNSETDSSLDFAVDCEYITQEQHRELTKECSEIGRMLGAMIKNPEAFLIQRATPGH